MVNGCIEMKICDYTLPNLLTIILYFWLLDLCISNCTLIIDARPRNFHSRFITEIKITQLLDFGAFIYTQGQLSCNTQLLHCHAVQLHLE